MRFARSKLPFYDSNGDGFLTAFDVLFIVNELNRAATAEGESTPTLVANDLRVPGPVPFEVFKQVQSLLASTDPDASRRLDPTHLAARECLFDQDADFIGPIALEIDDDQSDEEPTASDLFDDSLLDDLCAGL